MQFTPRDGQIVFSVAHYRLLVRPQIQRLHFPGDDGRHTRRRLQFLTGLEFIARTRMEVDNPEDRFGMPAYYVTRKGLEYLAVELGDDSVLQLPCHRPSWIYLKHGIALSETQIRLDQAVAKESGVSVAWIGEGDIADPNAKEPEHRFKLYTLVRAQPRLTCRPDAGVLMTAGTQARVLLLEGDRATSGIAQVVNKTEGYAEMAKLKLHKRIFPQTTDDTFAVLHVTTSPNRRNALAKAFRGKPGCQMWRFASMTELNAETFLRGPIWYPVEGEASSML